MGDPNERWELVVGLEVHVQLTTATKIFCACPVAFGAPPNMHTCPVCIGLPGALPVLNAQAVARAIRAGVALDGTVHRVSVFARKNYFYPDLPKGYQITQFEAPLVTGGGIGLGTERFIRLTRIHMEEDAGKSVHDRYPGETAVDLNRAGTPLIEIVTEPDLRSAAEAREFLTLLKEILQYAEVSDATMEEGSLRVDANVSVRPVGGAALGAKTEIKNMNSFSAVERAIGREYARQCARLDGGQRVMQETLLWDAQRDELRSARSKEESHDYRYFPEPDLPPLVISVEEIAQVTASLPELPASRRRRYREQLGVAPGDAVVLTQTRSLSDYFERVVASGAEPRTAAAWVTGDVLAYLNDRKETLEELRLTPGSLAGLIGLVATGQVSRGAAKQIMQRMANAGEHDAAAIAAREGLLQVRDDASLNAWVNAVFADHPAEVERLRQGEQKLLGVLVGAVIKRSGGRADPRRVQELVRLRGGAAP